MKKFILLTIAAAVCFGAVAAPVADDPKPPIIIPINPPVPITGKPKQVIGDDITAYYQNGVLTLNINVDLGYVDIEVINTATGESWSDTTNGFGSSSIYLSGESGTYLIYINTDFGTYSGEFDA